MTISTMSHSTAQTASFSSEGDWITPEKQFDRLVKKETHPIAQHIADISPLNFDVALMVAHYAMPASRITCWFTALQEIDRLPKMVPALSEEFIAFLDSPCPKHLCDERKPDGSIYAIKEKCTLVVIPEELGNVQELEKIVKTYGEKHYPKYNNPLQFQTSISYWYIEPHWSVPFGPTHWELHTDLLEESRNKNFEDQTLVIDSLAQKTSSKWLVQELPGTVTAIFYLKIGTGETLYPTCDSNSQYHSYIAVIEKNHAASAQLSLMSSSTGVNVAVHLRKSHHVGIGACLKIPSSTKVSV